MTKEEAIKIVRENMHLSYDEGNIFEALKTLIPELRDSEDEDEVIRKFIIDCINELRKANAENAEFNGRCSESIFYLERQKEQKTAEWSEEDKKMLNGIIERGNSEIPKGECGLTPNQVAWLETRLKSLRPQPKQKWSEEDETCLENALWCVMKTRHFVAKDACDLDACRSAEKWLKFLPERFNLQL